MSPPRLAAASGAGAATAGAATAGAATAGAATAATAGAATAGADLPDRGERAGTLARGLAVLESLAAAPQPMSLVEVAAETALDQSTAHRLLKALEEAGYVVRHAATKRYSPSPKLLHPLPLLHPLDQLRREAAPLLAEVAQRLRMTLVLVLFIGHERLVIDVAQQPGSVTPYYGTWLKGPLHATGGGKSLLLSLPAEQRRALLGAEPWAAATPHTFTAWEALDADMRLSSQRGYVVSRNEHRQGVTNIAALLSRWNGGAAGCLIASARSRDLDDAAIARAGDEIKRVAELLVYQAPSLEAASRFCGR
jgi:DNA-binding IclR family transcriptional regulator